MNSKRGMMGSFARRSTCTNTKAATMHSTNSPMIWNESQAYSVPPQAVASTSEPTEMAMDIMPPTSMGGRFSRRTGFVRKNMTAAMARSASGTLNANSQRHPVTCTNQPPRSGPTTVASANTEPMTPMYLPRWRGGMTSAMVACDRMMSPPPPKPSTARPKMSNSMLVAKPHTADPTMKTDRAITSRYLRPNRSPSLP